MTTIFRYVKPSLEYSNRLVRANTSVVSPTVRIFSGNELELDPMNFALFDVIRDNGVILPREQGFKPSYWFEGNRLKVAQSGEYTVRIFNDIMPFDTALIEVPSGNYMSEDGRHFNCGVPFWPQILYSGEYGIARVSNCGRNLSFLSNGIKDTTSIGYRLINAFGQVSEPACLNVTSI